jgi:hypothetical protein
MDHLFPILVLLIIAVPLAVHAADDRNVRPATGLWHCFESVYDKRTFNSRDKGESLVKLKSGCPVEWDAALRAIEKDGYNEQQARTFVVVLAQDFLLRKEGRSPIDRKGELAKYR